ncbi:hypothetical protein [Oceaniradius stylonematis]|jgi:hypothetical protein|uniref:hypothetical protein n=1 Tax=Oceaniradius stylonematis TaxID=2184161 RepID=UPI0035D12B50
MFDQTLLVSGYARLEALPSDAAGRRPLYCFSHFSISYLWNKCTANGRKIQDVGPIIEHDGIVRDDHRRREANFMGQSAETPAPRNPEIVQQIVAQSPSRRAHALLAQVERCRKAQSRLLKSASSFWQNSRSRSRMGNSPCLAIAIPSGHFGIGKRV